ncbi:MAG: hypothetical protein LBK66_14395 [Spirochaetaceae bacterium]|jgi:hypothetical protein|nr:hypothetical protein [Spirochaetaceae bacterium]
MESERKPSIFSDRGFIGSAGELDEYGVWVKSKPEDIAFDNNAFFDDISNDMEVTDNAAAFDFGVDAVASQSDLDESADWTSPDQSLDTIADEPETDIFDIDFGVDEPAEQLPDTHTGDPSTAADELETFDFDLDEPEEHTSGIHVEEFSDVNDEPETDTFDIDFGVDEPAEQLPDTHTGDPSTADESETDTFDIDFGVDEPAEQLPDILTGDPSIAADELELETFDFDLDEPEEQLPDIHTDDSSTADESETDTFDIDFGVDEPAEQLLDILAGDPSTAADELELETFDFDLDEPAEQLPDTHAGDPSTAADELELETFDFDLDEPEEHTSGIHVEEQEASTAAGELELETFDFDLDEPEEHISGIHVEEFSDANDEPETDTFDIDLGVDEPAEQLPDILTGDPSTAADELELETFDFNLDEPEEHISGIHVEEFSDANDEPRSDTSIADVISGSHDAETDFADIPEKTEKPKKPQAVDTGETENAALPQMDTRSTELLLKIVDELSTIKAELSRLKDEISNIRENIASADFQIEADVNGENETPSGEEPAAVINNAGIELKESDISGNHASVLDTEFLQMEDDAALSNEAGSLVENPVEFSAEDSAESPELSVDLDLSEEDLFPDTPPFGTEAEAAFSEIIEEHLVVPSLPQDETYTADYLSPDERAAIVRDDAAVLNEIAPPVELEPEPAAPQPELSKPLKPSPEPAVSQSEIDTQTAAQAAPPQTPLKAGEDITDSQQFKKELQVVLSYMDRLLESLPDEKIEEFARSKQFDIYKKVFKELGLV